MTGTSAARRDVLRVMKPPCKARRVSAYLMALSFEKENSMEIYRRVVFAISGLGIAGAAALTLGAAVPGNAEVVVIAPQKALDDNDDRGGSGGSGDEPQQVQSQQGQPGQPGQPGQGGQPGLGGQPGQPQQGQQGRKPVKANGIPNTGG
jgi:hypothetical protein